MSRLFGCLALSFLLPLLAVAGPPGERVPLAELQASTHIHGIAVDPKDPARIYLATHHGVFLVLPDGSATRVSNNSNDYMGFTPHPTDPAILYASGHPVGGGNLGFIMSSDGGKTWQQLAKGIDGPVDFHQMDVSKVDSNTIYGVFRGLQVSKDGGRTWEMAGQAPERLIDLAASAIDVDRLYAATERGLFVSHDRGKTWQSAYLLRRPATMVHTHPNGKVYAFIVGVGLIRGAEPDLRWQTLSKHFGDEYILHLALEPKNVDNLYAVTHKGSVLASSDGGRSWRRFGER